jgi:hypothetical protein
MVRLSRSPWLILLTVFICMLAVAFITTATIIRREGLEGLFERKRGAVKQVMPGAVPIVDRIETEVRGKS